MKKLFDYFYDEINFKEVFKDPKRWVGYSFIIIFLSIFGISLAYLDQIDHFYRNTTPHDEIDTTKQFKEVELSLGRKIEGIKVEEIIKPPIDMIKRGEEIYRTTCSSCHGETGEGNGLASMGLNPSPRNFKSKEGWKNGRTITQVYKTLQEGIIGSSMVSYSYLSTKEKIALFHKINKFYTDSVEISEKDIADLETTYKVTQTYELPPTIPITKAIDKILKENEQFLGKTNSISLALNDENLKKFIKDLDKFTHFLINARKDSKNIEDLIISTFPLNGISPKFIYSSEQEKKQFIDKILTLN